MIKQTDAKKNLKLNAGDTFVEVQSNTFDKNDLKQFSAAEKHSVWKLT